MDKKTSGLFFTFLKSPESQLTAGKETVERACIRRRRWSGPRGWVETPRVRRGGNATGLLTPATGAALCSGKGSLLELVALSCQSLLENEGDGVLASRGRRGGSRGLARLRGATGFLTTVKESRAAALWRGRRRGRREM